MQMKERASHTNVSKRPLALIAVIIVDTTILCAALCWICISALSLHGIATMPAVISHHWYEKAQTLRVVSGYGLFRRMTGMGRNFASTDVSASTSTLTTTARPEIIVEGLDQESNEWIEIPFAYKPGDVMSSPVLVAPHQPRLDWQMWFAALGSYQHNPWLVHLMYKILLGFKNSPEVHQLLDIQKFPFRKTPPVAVRAVIYDYDFSRWNSSWVRYNPGVTLIDNKSINNTASSLHSPWWIRSNPKEYLPALEKNNPSVLEFLEGNGIEASKSHKTPQGQYHICLKSADKFAKRWKKKIKQQREAGQSDHQTPGGIIHSKSNSSTLVTSAQEFTFKMITSTQTYACSVLLHREHYEFHTFICQIIITIVVIALSRFCFSRLFK